MMRSFLFVKQGVRYGRVFVLPGCVKPYAGILFVHFGLGMACEARRPFDGVVIELAEMLRPTPAEAPQHSGSPCEKPKRYRRKADTRYTAFG